MKICWKGIYFCTCPPNVHYFAGGRQKGGKGRSAKKIRFMYSPEIKLRGLSPNFHIHESLSNLYIPRIGPPILFLEQNKQTDH